MYVDKQHCIIESYHNESVQTANWMMRLVIPDVIVITMDGEGIQTYFNIVHHTDKVVGSVIEATAKKS